MVYCLKCNALLPGGASHCLRCGAPINTTQAVIEVCEIVRRDDRRDGVDVCWYEAVSQTSGAVMARSRTYRVPRHGLFHRGPSEDQIAALDQDARAYLVRQMQDFAWQPVVEPDGSVQSLQRCL